MAWTTPITFTTGNVLTAAQLNTNLRDNTNYLFDQPMALVTRSGSTTIASNVVADFVFGVTNWSSPGITVNLAVTSLTPTFAGTYETWANIAWAGSAAGSRHMVIYSVLSGDIVAATSLPAVATGHHIRQSCSGVTTTVLNGTTDNLRMQVLQDSGIAQTVFGHSTFDADFGLNELCGLGIKMLGTGS